MAHVTSPRRGARLPPQADPPRGDEGLDEWFARRLEAQGIAPGRRGIPVARIMAVTALVAALWAFWWAAGEALTGGGETAASASSSGTGKAGDGGSAGNSKKGTWRDVRLTVLNGYGSSGAASDAEQTLRADGWTIRAVGNAGTSTRRTVVVYTRGFRKEARLAARKLGLGAPVPVATAQGVPPDVRGVAVLLGPDGLPTAG
jgi:hypothetical protein